MQKQYTILINAPLRKTFSCITEQSKVQRIMHGSARVEFKSQIDPEYPVATKFHQNIAGLLSFDGEIISYKPPIEFGIALRGIGLKAAAFYNFSAVDPGHTKLDLRVEYFDGTKKAKIILKTFKPVLEQVIKKYLAGIKKVAETE